MPHSIGSARGALIHDASLVSEPEWSLLVVLLRFGRPASTSEIIERRPNLSPEKARALLERLSRQGHAQTVSGGLWAVSAPHFRSLLRRQIEHFFDAYLQDDPDALNLLREVLDARAAGRT